MAKRETSEKNAYDTIVLELKRHSVKSVQKNKEAYKIEISTYRGSHGRTNEIFGYIEVYKG